MKLAQLQRGTVSTITLEARAIPDEFKCWDVGREVQILYSASLGEHLVSDEAQSIEVDGRADHDRALLEAIIVRAQPRLCWVAQCDLNNGVVRLVVQVHEFAFEETWPETFPICLDEELVEKERTRRKTRITVATILEELRTDFLLPAGNGKDIGRALISMSSEGRRKHRTIRLVGKSKALDVRLSDEGGKIVARAYRMVQARAAQRNETRYPIWLVHADIQFRDTTDTGLSSVIRSEIDALVQNADSYLRVWELYGQMEKKALDEEAEEFGSVSYTSPRQIDELHWTFHVPDEEDLATCSALLRHGQHRDLCVGGSAHGAGGTNGRTQRFSAELVNVLPLTKTIELITRSPETPLPGESGQLELDLTGDSVRHNRRAHARELIRSTECAMPKLALILEGRQWKTGYRKKFQKIPQRVLDKFKSPPTEGQIRALLAAMNTPDVALIQGPPGTGKTQVISALLTWLAAPGTGEDDITRSTLVTSFQHDAVENVASRSRVYGLPPIRIGSRQQGSGAATPFEIWMAEMRHRMEQKLHEYEKKPVFLALNSVVDIHASYCVAPGTREDAARRIAEVLQAAGEWLSAELSDRGRELGQRLELSLAGSNTQGKLDRELLDAAIRGLRIEPGAFSDDGPRACFRLQRRLQGSETLSPKEEALLTAGEEWDSNKAPGFLAELRVLQERLLDEQADADAHGIQRQEIVDVSGYLCDVAAHLQERCKSARYGKDAVLFRFAAALERDPLGCKHTVEEYAAVLAATVGQSVGRSMRQVMAENACFRNVIVDEAARANPLDLMIPLSRAERRIILVGDHRQLPHVLETHIEREVNKSVEVQTRDLLGKSMFERLLGHVREQEKRDGIPRYAKLDKQFRMHPVLADFVNGAFYKPYGEEFSSGVESADFTEEVEPYGRSVAAWKRVPLGSGAETQGRSKSRPVEARWVAGEAKRLLENYPKYSVGIITFYTAQVKALEDALLASSVMFANPATGEMATSDEFKLTQSAGGETPKERLRVGTVDAFQGKEFDIVLLSMTRSNNLPASNEKEVRRKYGHLVLENRLCVAMSRQKRLLVVAGDDAMLCGDEAKATVGGLVKFHELCGGNYGAII